MAKTQTRVKVIFTGFVVMFPAASTMDEPGSSKV